MPAASAISSIDVRWGPYCAKHFIAASTMIGLESFALPHAIRDSGFLVIRSLIIRTFPALPRTVGRTLSSAARYYEGGAGYCCVPRATSLRNCWSPQVERRYRDTRANFQGLMTWTSIAFSVELSACRGGQNTCEPVNTPDPKELIPCKANLPSR